MAYPRAMAAQAESRDPDRVVVIDGERPLGTGVPREVVAALRAIGRRKELELSARFREHARAIEEVTYALAHGLPSRPAPRPERSFLRAVTWNIERGNRLDALRGFCAAEPAIVDADVVLLNEVDVGMARSGNRHVAREIADLFGFAWVFGNSYLCLSHGDARDGAPAGENELGLHGNAILSRWPIRRAECFSVAITKDKFESSEKRLGHKKALWAELETPLGTLPVVSVHLDPYASPEQRHAQMRDVLRMVERRGLGRRVLMGGDLNTTTYDLESLPRLAANIAKKLVRGGFPHAIEHYMRPHALYERAMFDELAREGFAWDPFNDMASGTVRYEVGTFDSESKIKDHLPGIFADLLRWKLRPWNGVAPLKIDWFLGRGLRALGDGEAREPGGRESVAPRVFERASHDGVRISDHDPIVVDVVPDDA